MTETEISPEKLADIIGKSVLSTKGEEVFILDMREISTVTDFFVICSGSSDIHTRAISDRVVEAMEKIDMRPWHIEGYDYGHWILLDYVDVVINIFYYKTREFYRLEKLWGDAPMKKLT